MADGSLTDTAPTASGWRAWPVALRIAVLYLSARAVTTGFLLVAAASAPVGSRFGPQATIGDLVAGWDATWYWFTAVNGYPTDLPRTEAGEVAENSWAFLPLYPYLAAALGGLTGSWPAAALTISLVAGYLACLVLHRLLRAHLDGPASMWAVLFFASGPLAALFQVAYAETLFLLWLLLALLCVELRRWPWLYLLIPVMGFTRPGVLAFSLFLALYGVWRWMRRRDDALPTREIVHIVVAGLWAAAVGFAWPVIAALATGVPDAYLATELAWRRNWVSDPAAHFLPFEGFLEGAMFWAGEWGWPGWFGVLMLALLVAGFAAALLFEPHVRRLGMPLRLWAFSYVLYLLAVFFPQSSTFRLLLPLSPLWGAVAAPRAVWWRVVVLAGCLAAQAWWIWNMYSQASTYWQVP